MQFLFLIFSLKPVKNIFCVIFRLSDLAMYSSEQLARKVISLSLRSNELTNAIHMSKEHMEKLKLSNQKQIRAEKQATQTRLKEQKNHYETVVARHQEFIEQVYRFTELINGRMIVGGYSDIFGPYICQSFRYYDPLIMHIHA